jgi:Arc/MetJ family transcription regulator
MKRVTGLGMLSKSKRAQITLDEDLMTQVRRAARRLKITPTAFVRQALQNAMKRGAVLELEAQHRRGYAAHPASSDEFSKWEAEQAWTE